MSQSLVGRYPSILSNGIWHFVYLERQASGGVDGEKRSPDKQTLRIPDSIASIASAPRSPSDQGQLPQSHRKTPSHFPPQKAGEGFQARLSLQEMTWVGGQKLSAPQTVLHLA